MATTIVRNGVSYYINSDDESVYVAAHDAERNPLEFFRFSPGHPALLRGWCDATTAAYCEGKLIAGGRHPTLTETTVNPDDPEAKAAIARIKAERAAQGERLVWCAESLMHHALVLQGLEEDHTGLGSWQIFCQNFEIVMGVKVVPADQYAAMLTKPRE